MSLKLIYLPPNTLYNCNERIIFSLQLPIDHHLLHAGVGLDLFGWGGGVSKFCQVMMANFAETLQPLINIFLPKLFGIQYCADYCVIGGCSTPPPLALPDIA
jgi:hypothetical protein